ncbi:hypothetical protein CPB84DRAFT_1746471 [Gymnopilus junonius]|uniref:Uncharacterized protein n=1 Tax=Gymnopilus junonius TaxID=109634 RepID=A0A9P5TP67_GYMJU|nr:hypothetical protein CPB84DRAFT_1746471 [Gymnopilus junonius]
MASSSIKKFGKFYFAMKSTRARTRRLANESNQMMPVEIRGDSKKTAKVALDNAQKNITALKMFAKSPKHVPLIKNFINLKELEVEMFTSVLDNKFLMVLAHHPSLEVVSLTKATFGVDALKLHIALRGLSIKNHSSRYDVPNPAIKLIDIFSQECSDILDLYHFISSCPNLEEIQMKFVVDYNDNAFIFPPIPGSVIPNLTSFSGPNLAAMVFIPGWPVKNIAVDLGAFDTDVQLSRDPSLLFLPLSQSTQPITELVIQLMEGKKEVLEQVLNCFPPLEVLRFSLETTDPLESDEESRELLDDKESCRYAATCADAYRDPIGGGYNLNRKTHFCYIHVHTNYLKFLRSVALKEIQLPPTIKSLSLHEYELVKHFEDMYIPKTNKAEAAYAERYGKPYMASMAQDVFKTLSGSYPALKSVVIGERYRGRLRWVRDGDGSWTYDTALSLVEYQHSIHPPPGAGTVPMYKLFPWSEDETDYDSDIDF